MPQAVVLQSAGQCLGGGDSEKVDRETDSLILPLGLIFWLIRTCE